MSLIYACRTFRIRPQSWPQASAHIFGPGAKAVADAGGKFYGLWTPLIGLASNRGIAITAWPDADAADRQGDLLFDGMAELLDADGERLQPTARPTQFRPPREPGIYAFRWFDLQAAHWPEFLQLSRDAWPAFENAFAAEILGFWRSLDVAEPEARVLLLTRYPSLEAWERSRHDFRTEDERATADRFRRRRELTDTTLVVTMQLATSAAAASRAFGSKPGS